jgi:hypothetical protein
MFVASFHVGKKLLRRWLALTFWLALPLVAGFDVAG